MLYVEQDDIAGGTAEVVSLCQDKALVTESSWQGGLSGM
jgi:hypothetical protein